MKLRKSKYNNIRRPCAAGHLHDSIKESVVCTDLQMLEKAGEIRDLVNQPSFPIVINGIRVCAYRADFQYTDERTKENVVLDVKGMKTAIYRLKKKLMKAVLAIDVVEQ